MKSSELNRGWTLYAGDDLTGEGMQVSLPVDVYTCKAAAEVLGISGDTRVITLVKKLPSIKRFHKAILDVCGVCGWADVYLNDIMIDTITTAGHNYFEFAPTIEAANELRLVITVSPEMCAEYTGLGVMGEVRLIASENKTYIEQGGFFITTAAVEEKASLIASVEVVNDGKYDETVFVDVSVYNAKGKRAGRRRKRVSIRAGQSKLVEVPVKVARPNLWSLSDPYMYTATAEVGKDTVLDESVTAFGIRTLKLKRYGLYVNDEYVKLKGAILGGDNGLLGKVSFLSYERRRAKLLKESGFNAVRFTGCPTQNALAAMDEFGLLAIVDIFDVWHQPKTRLDNHLFFDRLKEDIIYNTVRFLRNHPCLAMYSLGAGLPESYGRGAGAELAAQLVGQVKMLDDTRPVIATLSELKPTYEEIKDAGGDADRLLAKEKQEELKEFAETSELFEKLTADFAACFDAIGYDRLQRLYAKERPHGLTVFGTDCDPNEIFDCLTESEKNEIASDFGKVIETPRVFGAGRIIPTLDADMDIIGDRKPQSYYREVVMGERDKSYIVAYTDEEDEFEALPPESIWNFPRHLGKQVNIDVYTGGDIVALYLDGKLIGRKLAGRTNRHIASFKTAYYPGKLEAVSFYRGNEYSRVTLESVTAPRTIKTFSDVRYVRADSDRLCYIEISVVDAQGRCVPYAHREAVVEVEGGELVALGTGNPEGSIVSGSSCAVYNGRALAIVKVTDDEKATVTVTGEGLRKAKLAIKVK